MKDHKLAAIVFTDIVGYTRRMDADEEGTMKLLARQREIIFPMVKEFGGEVIKEIGDGLLMMFTSANRAVRFAMAVQEKIKDDELTIRAGIHIGDVIFEEGDVFGSAVNIAARIEPLAPAGGICISKDVRSQIRNQGDIITVSIGKKELKGVDQAVEIYQVVEEKVEEHQRKVPFFKDLWQRRVIQITAIYLIMSYLLKLGIGFMVKEYMLSPHLTSLIWYILLSLIPSIILISYFHGRKGVSKWTKIELFGLPINIIAAVLVLIIVFKGKDLGAIATKVTIQNEDGENIEKLLVKNEYRKKILIFNVENISGDTALDYLQYGIPRMTEYDLSQDLLITPIFIMELPGFYTELIESGYPEGTGLPITLMKNYAENRHMNYFMFGDIDRENDEYLLNVKLFDTKLTRLVSEFSVRDQNPFILVDIVSVELKKAMEIPEIQLTETIDYPVADIFTDSENSLLHFSLSIREQALNNYEDQIRLLNLAIQEDPDFAIAHVALALSYLNTGNMESTRNGLLKGKELLHKLPDRWQFAVKYIYNIVDQKPEKAMTVLKMWVEFYPDDILAHSMLAQRYAVRNMFTEAIQEYKEIFRLDPEQYQVLSTIGDYYYHVGNFDSALVYYKKHVKLAPKQASAYNDLGDYYYIIGDMESAKENYEWALALADLTEEIPIKVDIADISLKTGDFEMAYDQYMDALRASRSARDSMRVLSSIERYYFTKGQIKKYLETYKQKLVNIKSVIPPKDYLVYQILHIDVYVNAGELDKAFEVLDEIKSKLEPPLDNLVPFGYMLAYAEMGDTIKAMEAFSGAEDLIEGFGEEILRINIYYAQGRLDELTGNYYNAIENYNSFLELDPTSYYVHTNIARSYRLLKDFKEAEKEIQISLKNRPFEPIRNYEAALLYLEMGDEEQGLEYLERAVDIWKDADPDYEKANLAKEKLNSLK